MSMDQKYKVTGMTCNGCANTVQKAALRIQGVEQAIASHDQNSLIITADRMVSADEVAIALQMHPGYKVDGAVEKGFWADPAIWSRSGFNTLNCLIGCSIGDFGMIIYLQAFHPQVSMATQMVLAIIAGLITSIMLETILLRLNEKFSWRYAFQTAFSMSFISMVAMELAMNTTDFMITGGKAAFSDPGYWFALLVAMFAGFLCPWPYNYYKLKKFNKACH